MSEKYLTHKFQCKIQIYELIQSFLHNWRDQRKGPIFLRKWKNLNVKPNKIQNKTIVAHKSLAFSKIHIPWQRHLWFYFLILLSHSKHFIIRLVYKIALSYAYFVILMSTINLTPGPLKKLIQHPRDDEDFIGVTLPYDIVAEKHRVE